MPAPDKVADFFQPMSPEIFDAFNPQRINTPINEIAELRKDIADLKALMTPSIILTGQRVIDEYWDITKPK